MMTTEHEVGKSDNFGVKSTVPQKTIPRPIPALVARQNKTRQPLTNLKGFL